MKSRQELRKLIEEARLDLDRSLELHDEFEVYYKKSIFLDKLIEEYIDIQDKGN